MEDLQMFDEFSISSKIIGTYSVRFITDLSKQLTALSENEKTIFIVDKNILDLFREKFEVIRLSARLVTIESNELNKTLDYSQEVIRKLLQLNVRKDDKLIAIGGGITQDIVAFISSIIFRGVEWIFLPTTLLAQCDSCIGSKSSINFDQYKNLIGTFNPPSQIFIYQGFLSTLSQTEIRSGIGEMLHYYFTEGITLAKQIKDNFNRLLVDRSLLPYYISNSIRIKKKVIELDEFDTSLRHIFNYGHTFGHAIEVITSYKIPHGQAISIGMDLANYISLEKGMISENEFAEMHEILVLNIPSFRITNSNIEDYCQVLTKDKKNKGNMLGCILTRGAGKVEKVFIEMDPPFRQTLLNYSLTYSK